MMSDAQKSVVITYQRRRRINRHRNGDFFPPTSPLRRSTIAVVNP